MMSKEFLKYKNFFIVCGVVIIVLEIFNRYTSELADITVKSYFYLKNEQTLQNDNYIIKLPFPEWVISKDYETYYYAFYATPNSNIDIRARIDKFVFPIDSLNYELLSELCEEMCVTNKEYANIAGIEVECINLQANNEVFFNSNDGYFAVKFIIYEGGKGYQEAISLLLNSIKKKNDVKD